MPRHKSAQDNPVEKINEMMKHTISNILNYAKLLAHLMTALHKFGSQSQYLLSADSLCRFQF